jgi:hypothetical protein
VVKHLNWLAQSQTDHGVAGLRATRLTNFWGINAFNAQFDGLFLALTDQ